MAATAMAKAELEAVASLAPLRCLQEDTVAETIVIVVFAALTPKSIDFVSF